MMENKKIKSKTFNLYSKDKLESLCNEYQIDKSTLFRALIDYIYEYPTEFVEFSNQKRQEIKMNAFAMSLICNHQLKVGLLFYQDGLSLRAEKGTNAYVEDDKMILINSKKTTEFQATIDMNTIQEITVVNMKNGIRYPYYVKERFDDNEEYVELKCEVI